jgi:hypothetical protein
MLFEEKIWKGWLNDVCPFVSREYSGLNLNCIEALIENALIITGGLLIPMLCSSIKTCWRCVEPPHVDGLASAVCVCVCVCVCGACKHSVR